ncbi:MAG: PHP domain-containing protein [Lachnospiraceae bacterium]|nr:PHP domain-containing protein [Lachnospiraceae bacterium]
MSLYTYDLHVHSCLSPCADNDNTPNNLAGMATLNNIQIMALTDHNSCRNCPAFFTAAKRYGIIPIPGMELTTSEDIHVICLFPDLQSALDFNDEVDTKRIRFRNNKEIFGDQLILDGEDEVIGEEEDFLTNATEISYEEVPELVDRYGGACYPAHIDREANGVIAILGTLPEEPDYPCAELHFMKNVASYTKEFHLENKRVIVSSDAHYLEDLREENDTIEIPDEPYSSDLVRRNLIRILRGEKL